MHHPVRSKADGEETAPAGPAVPSRVDEAAFSAEALGLSRGAADSRATEHSGLAEAAGASEGLSGDERREVDKLKARDAEVRAHEAAHMAAGGSHVRGGASYAYQQGPDGRSYAIGGEVGIDVSAVAGNPQATIQKMQQVRAAALAPAEPSGADRAVAAAASQAESRAREQLSGQRGVDAERVSARYSSSTTESKSGRVIDTAA